MLSGLAGRCSNKMTGERAASAWSFKAASKPPPHRQTYNCLVERPDFSLSARWIEMHHWFKFTWLSAITPFGRVCREYCRTCKPSQFGSRGGSASPPIALAAVLKFRFPKTRFQLLVSEIGPEDGESGKIALTERPLSVAKIANLNVHVWAEAVVALCFGVAVNTPNQRFDARQAEIPLPVSLTSKIHRL